MKYFLILIAIILFSVLLITILRAVVTFLIIQGHVLKEYNSYPFQKQKKHNKKDEELLRKKDEIPKDPYLSNTQDQTNKNGSYRIIKSGEQERIKHEINSSEIVDFVKPIGFWTSMILGQKLTYLIQSAKMMKEQKDKGFWVNMVEAKDREFGKQHSRGR